MGPMNSFRTLPQRQHAWCLRNRRIQRVVPGVLVTENAPLQLSFVIPYVSSTHSIQSGEIQSTAQIA